MSVFPTDRHLASWAGLCPSNNESAGKHKSGKTRRGARWLRSTLNEAALAAIRPAKSAFGARYRRIMRHRWHKKTIIARTTSLPKAPPTASSGLTTTTAVTPNGSRAGPFEHWNVRATVSASSQQLSASPRPGFF